jgi:glycosyltransferase involved in cell wall biosynthesis
MNTVSTLRVLTVFDPHLDPAETGSVIHDLYVEAAPYTATVLACPGRPVALTNPIAAAFGHNVRALPFPNGLWAGALAQALRNAGEDAFDLVHCPQLGAPVTQAVAVAFPHRPRLGIVHPVDLARAFHNSDQHAALHRAAHDMNLLAVPTETVADMLLEAVPDLDTGKLITLPYPVPDHLLTTPIRYPRPGAAPRVLYAGPAGESVERLLVACKRARAQLTLMVPPEQFESATDLARSAGAFPVIHRAVGRAKLWELYGSIDAVAAPEPGPLAYSRTALEAQARGVPVIYQTGSGIAEVLTGAIAVDFADSRVAAATITEVCTSPTLLGKLRIDARDGAGAHRLSAVHKLLDDVNVQLVGGRSPHAATPAPDPVAAIAGGQLARLPSARTASELVEKAAS